MDGNGQGRASCSSSIAQSPTTYDDDSDTISLTSTVMSAYSPDAEWDIEDVHGEREQEIDGQLQRLVLVEWADFPLDQCTWEPLENLPEQLAIQWEERKATQDPAVALEFEEQCNSAFNAELEASRKRHCRRNEKRKKLGLPTTSFCFRKQKQPDSEHEMEQEHDSQGSKAETSSPSSDNGDECDKADEDSTVEHKATEALESTKPTSKAKLPNPPRPPNRFFTFNPDKALPTEERAVRAESREAALPISSSTWTRPSSSKEQPSNRLSQDREVPSATAYQGTARKFSTTDSSLSRTINAGALNASDLASTSISARTPASVAPAVTASSNAAKKTVKERKTLRRTSQAVNIFFGGKISRTRQSGGDIELDRNQPPKLYTKHHHRWKAEKRGRDREDQAPDIAKIAKVMFAPGANSVLVPGPNAENMQSNQKERASVDASDSEGGPSEAEQDSQEQPRAIPPTQLDGAGSATTSTRHAGLPKRSSLSSGVDRPSKKAKKVHFIEVEAGPSVSQGPSAIQTRSERFPEADDKWIPKEKGLSSITGDDGLFVSEPMEIDSTSVSSSDSPIDTSSSTSTAGAEGFSLFTHKARNVKSVRCVGKKMKLSTSPERILDVTFDSIPKATSLGTAEQWLNDFIDASCLDIGHMVLAETFVAQLLSLSSQNLQTLCSGTITSISHSEDLDVVAEHLRVGSSGLFVARAHFNLLVFPTKCADFDSLNSYGIESITPGDVALKYFIFSSAVPIFEQIRPSSSSAQGLRSRVGEEKVLLFPTILGIQYSALVASSIKDKKKSVHFFLAFPERAIEWQRSIASWLSTRERTCKIYTNFDSGSWLAFVEKAKREFGVIIVHEALVQFLRKFPQLAKLLLKYPVNIWHFSESLDLEPPQPLVGSEIVPTMSTKLSRLFPAGSVALVTPSFIVSEPQAAYRLFKWFFEVRAKFGNHKLMFAYNIGEYLSDLSREKTALRSRLEDNLWKQSNKGPLDIAMDKRKGALTDQDLEARQKTWLYMEWWLSQQVQSEVAFSEFNPAIFVDRSIDPHDEQSLVNWFGWWSLEHSHEYRKFYVLGSSSRTESGKVHTLTSRASRKVPLAKYSRTVVNDTDKAQMIPLSKRVPPSAEDFESKCFHNDENRIGPWLESQDRGYFAKLYRFPVSWVDKRMAAHCGDPSLRFKTIEQWWDSVPPWNSGTHHYNTFAAFFYTVSEEWDPDRPPKAIQPKSHPWIAIWRPVDPHFKGTLYSHGKTELILWDVRAGQELERKQSVQLRDLTWMQRALISHIRLHAREKNPNSFLERVWLGGFQAHQSAFASTQPADITAEYVMSLLKDLTHMLPGLGNYLTQNGYRPVALTIGEMELPSADNEEQSDDDCNTRMIFHAPRGSADPQSTGISQCTNNLFEAARLERLRFKPAKEMVYTYPPTLTWYRKQVAEGRHFEHILVDEWEKIFSVMGVDKSSSAPVSAASDVRASRVSARKGSASSNHSSTTS